MIKTISIILFADVFLSLNSLNGIDKGRTRKALYDLLKDCLGKAELLKVLEDNPMPLVTIASYVIESGKALTAAEEQTL